MSSVKFKAFLFSLITSLFCLSYSYGESKKAYVIGVENIDYMPYYTGDPKEDTFKGYSKDVLDLFAKSQNIIFEYVRLPVKRLILEFIEKGTIDFKYPDNPAWTTHYWADLKKRKKVFYSDPDVISKTGIAVQRKDNMKPIHLCKIFGLIRGFTPQSYVKFLSGEGVKTLRVGSINSLIEVLLHKRVSCIYISKEVLKYHLEKSFNQRGTVLFQDHLPYDLQLFSLSSILYPDLIEAYNQFLKDKKTEIAVIGKRYGMTPLGTELSLSEAAKH